MPLPGPEDTRSRLIREGRRVFESKGYHATIVEDIVSVAGVARGTFYRYFKSKEDIFRAIAAEVQEQLLAAHDLPPLEDARTFIEIGMRKYLALFREHALMIERLEEAAAYDPAIREARVEIRVRLSEETAEFLQRLQARGEVNDSLDVLYVSQFIGAMVDRIAYIWFVFGRDFEEERAISELVSTYLRMIGWHQSPESSVLDVVSSTSRPDALAMSAE